MTLFISFSYDIGLWFLKSNDGPPKLEMVHINCLTSGPAFPKNKKNVIVLFNTVIAGLNTVLKICSKRPLILCDVLLFHTALII